MSPRSRPCISSFRDARRLPNGPFCNPRGSVNGSERNVTAESEAPGRGAGQPVGRSHAEPRHHPTGIRPSPPFSGGMWAGGGCAAPGPQLTLCVLEEGICPSPSTAREILATGDRFIFLYVYAWLFWCGQKIIISPFNQYAYTDQNYVFLMQSR